MVGEPTKRLTMHDRPFDGRLKEVCIRKEGSNLRLIAIPNPDYIPVNLREEGSRLMRPTPKAEYQSMSDAEYKAILIEYEVTENPPDTFGVTGNSQQTMKANSIPETSNSTVGHAGLSAIPTAPKTTTNFISATENESKRLIEFYGTDNWAKLEVMARKDLGIDNPRNIIKPSDRIKHFQQFVKENFMDISKASPNLWPANMKTTISYGHIERYALTEYGALTIQEILFDNPTRLPFDAFVDPLEDNYTHTYRFEVRYISGSPQGGFNHIAFPSIFPDGRPFSGGELKEPIAIVHHEFGHTRFYSGEKGIVDITIQHEREAVFKNSNPVRILNGFEPRYTYTKKNLTTGKIETINILTKQVLPHTKGKAYTIKKDDPSVLMVIGSVGALI